MTPTDKNISRRPLLAACDALAAALLALAPAAPAAAQSKLSLEVPVDCRIPDECAVQNYFDHEIGGAERDSGCGPLTYDGHRGIDFALPDLEAMRRGVEVRAAAAGTVLRTRDGEPDVHARARRPEALLGREAGNSVIVDHGHGWQTRYSHLRMGSVAVRGGDYVREGERLGLIGHSGEAEFPHLHFEVRHNGRAIDPFTGPAGACGDFAGALWDDDALLVLDYRPTGLVRAGFAREAPQIEIIRAGGYGPGNIPRHPESLVFWTQIYGLQKGDVMRMRLEGANGKTIARHEDVAERHRAQQMWFTGARKPRDGWSGSAFHGFFELRRGGRTVLAEQRVLELE